MSRWLRRGDACHRKAITEIQSEEVSHASNENIKCDPVDSSTCDPVGATDDINASNMNVNCDLVDIGTCDPVGATVDINGKEFNTSSIYRDINIKMDGKDDTTENEHNVDETIDVQDDIGLVDHDGVDSGATCNDDSTDKSNNEDGMEKKERNLRHKSTSRRKYFV